MLHKPYTKILIDGGDPAETLRVKELLGFLDGQTTNPSLIAHNPEIVELVKSGHKLSKTEEDAEYKKIVTAISPLVGDAGVSIEVYCDPQTTAESMLAEAREKFSWVSNAYIKFPITNAGLQAAHFATAEGIHCNLTLCFTQEQAAAAYVATLGAKEPVYVSPFIGRLDDINLNGIDLIKNIKQMYAEGDGHIKVLAASVRSLDHLMALFYLQSDLVTVPIKILEEWAAKDFVLPDSSYIYDHGNLEPIPYKEIHLDDNWEKYDIHSDLTDAGIKKFDADYNSTLK
jgi:transaldolase